MQREELLAAGNKERLALAWEVATSRSAAGKNMAPRTGQEKSRQDAPAVCAASQEKASAGR
jgi:hypothetical protein